MWYAKFSLCKISLFLTSRAVSHLLPTCLFAKHANATKPYASDLALLIIPSSSCSKWTASQAFRDTPDVLYLVIFTNHPHRWKPLPPESAQELPLEGAQLFFFYPHYTPAVAHVHCIKAEQRTLKCFCTCTHLTTSRKAKKLVRDARHRSAQGAWKGTSVQGAKHKQGLFH